MSKMSKTKFTYLLIVASIVIIFVFKLFIEFTRGELEKGALARARGNPKAKVQVVEYVDFQCPACAKGAIFLHQLLEKYPDDLYIELKYFPLGFHRHALNAARHAECSARQGKFWPFVDLVFEKQSEWKNIKSDATDVFQSLAEQSNVDLNRLNICLEDQAVVDFIIEEKEKGESLGIKSTPTYFINGKMVVGSISLSAELEPLLTAEEK